MWRISPVVWSNSVDGAKQMGWNLAVFVKHNENEFSE
jgi:hypothetical protein